MISSIHLAIMYAMNKRTQPAFYRQKILLALLHAFGGKLSKLDLQKLLFLFVEEVTPKKGL